MTVEMNTGLEEQSEVHNEIIDIPQYGRGRIRWKILQEEGVLTDYFESWAKKLMESGIDLQQLDLEDEGQKRFRDRAVTYYPGGISKLRVNLGIEDPIKSYGYWTIEVIKSEAENFYMEHGLLTSQGLRNAGREDLLAAIGKFPGRIRGLRSQLNIKDPKKGDGYWTSENIKKEAKVILETHGKLSHSLLVQTNNSGLSHAISTKYAGGMLQLLSELGIEQRKPIGYWTIETIKEEAKLFFETYSHLNYSFLYKQKRTDLANAISHFYPGGIHQLQRDFDIKIYKHKTGYWTAENTELEAKKVYEIYGKLTYQIIREKFARLGNGIRKYPGGIQALRQKLNISNELPGTITIEKANSDLEKLLEENNEI